MLLGSPQTFIWPACTRYIRARYMLNLNAAVYPAFLPSHSLSRKLYRKEQNELRRGRSLPLACTIDFHNRAPYICRCHARLRAPRPNVRERRITLIRIHHSKKNVETTVQILQRKDANVNESRNITGFMRSNLWLLELRAKHY